MVQGAGGQEPWKKGVECRRTGEGRVGSRILDCPQPLDFSTQKSKQSEHVGGGGRFFHFALASSSLAVLTAGSLVEKKHVKIEGYGQYSGIPKVVGTGRKRVKFCNILLYFAIDMGQRGENSCGKGQEVGVTSAGSGSKCHGRQGVQSPVPSTK